MSDPLWFSAIAVMGALLALVSALVGERQRRRGQAD